MSSTRKHPTTPIPYKMMSTVRPTFVAPQSKVEDHPPSQYSTYYTPLKKSEQIPKLPPGINTNRETTHETHLTDATALEARDACSGDAIGREETVSDIGDSPTAMAADEAVKDMHR